MTFSEKTSITYPDSGYLVRDSNGNLDVYWVNPNNKKGELYDFMSSLVTFELGKNRVKIVDKTEEPDPDPKPDPDPTPDPKPDPDPDLTPNPTPTPIPVEKEPVVTQLKDTAPKTGETNIFNWSLAVMVMSGAEAFYVFSKKYKRQ